MEGRTAELRTAIYQLEREIGEYSQAEKTIGKAFSEIKKLKDQIEAEKIYLRQEIKMKHQFGNIIIDNRPDRLYIIGYTESHDIL